MPRFTLNELAEKLSLECKGNPDHVVVGVASLEAADTSQLSFCRSAKHAKVLAETQAGVVIVSSDLGSSYEGNCLLAADPQQAFIQAIHLLHPEPKVTSGCHPSAVIHESVSVPKSAFIGPHVVIEEGVVLGENVVVSAGTCIGMNCRLGDNAYLAPNVVLYRNVRLGNRVVIHASSVIGADGFGYHRDGYVGPWQKVPQIGGVVIEDDVEIGASTTIDRGALEDTYISKGVKIDNQVMIAHNVSVGEYTAIAGCSGIAGSTKVGKNCIIAGHCGVSDNISLADHVILLGKSGAARSVSKPGIYGSGTVLLPVDMSHRLSIRLKNLDKTIKDICNKLEKKNG